jgi:hypothetical protein
MLITNVDLEAFSGRRVVTIAALIVLAGVVWELAARRSVAGALSLTLAGAVAIINFRWLELLLKRVIGPGEPHFDRGSLLRISGRMALFALLFGALVWVPQLDPVAITIGFSALVVALLIEGFRWARVGGD